jgi:hypothetical protein
MMRLAYNTIPFLFSSLMFHQGSRDFYRNFLNGPAGPPYAGRDSAESTADNERENNDHARNGDFVRLSATIPIGLTLTRPFSCNSADQIFVAAGSTVT